ncbi:MAG: DNA repair protein MmcB-related protein [Hyphomicrobiales bacterium]|nr:MAG: DNA repair protein MmcB-related protein [Hyphomicrobiales bacterium]
MSVVDSVLNPPPTRPDITRAVCRGAGRHLRERGYAVVKEMTFANGRRGDIVALSPSGELLVVEVKSGIEDYRVDGKWPDYRDYCDGFLFAVAPEFPEDILPEDVGLIVADAYGGALIREAPRHALAPARRKALTIAFARLAAGRLGLIEDPGFQA